MRSEEKLAGEKAERKLTGERRDRGTKQEMDLQAREGLQVLQEMSRKEERPKAYPVMYTAATRGVLEYYYCRIQNSNYCTKLQVHHCFPNSICSWW